MRGILLPLVSAACMAAQPTFATAKRALPVFNSMAAAASRVPLKPDACGQVRSLEFLALPDTAFIIVGQADPPEVLEVTTSDYPTPPELRLYVSRDALRPIPAQPPQRARTRPRREVVLQSLCTAQQTPYVWGGNLRQGVPLGDTLGAYAGLDCSGLLYEATGGFTPRNTGELVHYGSAVPIQGLGRDQIIARLEPLDLIAWKGHVIIVLDRETVIESRLPCQAPGRHGGVMTAPLRQRLDEVMAQRSPADAWPAGEEGLPLFVVRRWLE
ncbi:hypothetical protein [Holophaga foetida]|uniref:hypothetical protein n=1 Tax=Holophaga foetida TaxID=35839 RepID=UPI0002471779|nr:hypothetical protein [Holophaga foetida]